MKGRQTDKRKFHVLLMTIRRYLEMFSQNKNISEYILLPLKREPQAQNGVDCVKAPCQLKEI